MRFAFAASLLVLPTLTGCAPGVVSHLDLTTITHVGDAEEVRTMPATLRIPQRESSCEFRRVDFAEAFAQLIPVTGEGKCVDEGDGVVFVELPTLVTLIPHGTERPADGSFVIEVATSLLRNHPYYELTFLSMRSYEELTKVVTDLTDGRTEMLGDTIWPEISFTIQNDTELDMGLQFEQAFVNGHPMMPDQGMLIEQSDTFEVTLSDVASAVIANGNGHMFVTVYPDF